MTVGFRPTHTLLILLPSLRISGGVQETLRMARALASRGTRVKVLALWKHSTESDCRDISIEYLSSFKPSRRYAMVQFPLLLLRFLLYLKAWRQQQSGNCVVMLTHFSTFPFRWLLSKRTATICFNQDREWLFVSGHAMRRVVRRLILSVSRKSKVVTTNSFVSQQFILASVPVYAQASIWADRFWGDATVAQSRSVDVVMLLRQGAVKRLDLYIEALISIQRVWGWRCCVFTPDDEVYRQIRNLASDVMLRPSDSEMRKIYRDAKVFLLLSDVEGFGLPPLEAMGAGCVPICRDCGGVSCYMNGSMKENLLPHDWDVEQILRHVGSVLADSGRLAFLSSQAQQAFERGLTTTFIERERCFDRMAEELFAGGS